MRLLIVTQKVDKTDPILGFFHRWVEEFVSHSQQLTVIGQAVGEYGFADKVKVLSLGKEKGFSKWDQITRFWRHIWRYKDRYDAVLVHMTPVWIILGAPVWLILRKRMYLWYEVKRGGWMLWIAMLFAKKIFAATSAGVPFSSSKIVVTGHGIDTDLFRPVEARRQEHLISTVGRITRIKKMDLIMKTLLKLPPMYHLVIGGGPITKQDEEYVASLDSFIQNYGLTHRVHRGFLTQPEVAVLLQKTMLFLHACGGGLDKAVLEAMACGCLVVSSSDAAKLVLPPECQATDQTLGEVAEKLLVMHPSEQRMLREQMRTTVERDHSLPSLIEKLMREMSGK
jgi:glycosyltransferase involved in cell wall biosynthesis